MSNEQNTQAGANFLTNDQIAAGAAIECDHGAPIGRNVAIDVFDAMRAAAPVAAQAGQVAVPGQADIEWSHDVQERLIAAGVDESDEVRGLMAEAASLLAALTGRPAPSPAKESK
ncbi:hypothetical protein [Massilia sp. YIM B02443]|uniref:hypothetical protein n=1 Tax=Massilia sp. YIM B02443 TaxID=3050127 RepID=UPI0025B67190|nr:hypothetical protein [Massilia sp. YIM B02443]MDN4038682.1 hypothetical protein [Massilia sp. YIM B02443]